MTRNRHDGTFKGGIPSHANGTANISWTTHTFNPTAGRVIIRNTHADQELLVSFDEGSSFFMILSGTYLDLDNIGIDNLILSGSNTGTTYEMIFVE